MSQPAENEACLPHDHLTDLTLRDGRFVCMECGTGFGIEQPPTIGS